MGPAKKDVLVVSSHVVAGAVGNRAMVFAFERLGHAVWAVPTAFLPRHRGHGPARCVVPSDADFEAVCEALAKMPGIERIGGVVTGFFAGAGQIAAAARLIGLVKEANPNMLYLCDPVIGDAVGDDRGRLYVAAEIADAVRDRLLPLADIITPNRFECAWLAGCPNDEAGDATEQAYALSPATVVVTSHPALAAGQIGNLMVRGGETVLAEHQRVASGVKGTGDLFAALLLARLMEGRAPARALEIASNSTFEMVAAAARLRVDELPLAAAQEAIVRPRQHVGVRRLSPAARPVGVLQ